MEMRGVILLTLASLLWVQTDAQVNGGDILDFNLGIGSSPIDLIIMIDTSKMDNTSQSQIEQEAFKDFFIQFLESADIESGNVRVAMVTYSTHPEIVFRLNTYTSRSQVQNAIRETIFVPGERNTADAIGMIRQQVLTRSSGDRPDIPNVVLMLHTGRSDRHQSRTLQEADALKFARTNIFGLGYNLHDEAETELDNIASRPTLENTFKVDLIEDFQIIKDIVFAQIFTRAEQAHKSPVGVSEKLDLVFLIHISNRMKKSEFTDVKHFLGNIVKSSNIDEDDLRVALAVYRKRGTVLFDFNQHLSKADVLQALYDIPYKYKAKFSSIAEGLDIVREKILIDTAGCRRDVPNLVIIVTNAVANTDVGRTIEAAEKLKISGTAIFGAGINMSYPDELRAIISSEDYTIFVNDTKWLSGQEVYLQDQFVGLHTATDFEIPHEDKETSSTILATSTVSTTLNFDNRDEADVAIALHVAKNVKIKNIKNSLHPFLSDLIKAADVDSGAVRFSITVFGPDAEVQFGFDKWNKEVKLLKAIKRLKPKFIRKPLPDTAKLFDVLTSSVFSEARPQVEKVLIFITDQKSTGNAQIIQDKANELKAAGTSIFTIGLTRANKKEVREIASDPVDDNHYFAASYKDLANDELKNKLGEQIFVFKSLRPVQPTTEPATTTPKVTEPPTTTTEATTTQEPTTTTTETVTTTPSSFVWPLSGSEEADIVIALHLSPSTSEFDFLMTLSFLRSLIAGADVDTGRVQLGLMYYNADPEVIFHINQYTSMEDIEDVISNIGPEKRSFRVDASGALGLARQMLSSYFNRREWVPAALIFITDAASTENVEYLESETNRAQEDHINIFSIGAGLREKAELELLATAPENVMTVSRVQELDSTIDEIKRKIFAFRTRLVPTRGPAGPVITVPMPSEEPPIRITLPPSQFGKKVPDDLFIDDERNRFRDVSNQRCGVIELDLVILLDSSTSVTENNFRKMLNATKRFVADKDIDIDNGLVRVAIVVYSNTAEPQFYLNTYTRKQHILEAIDKIRFTYGRTNITGALKLMRTIMFTPEKGDRIDVPNVGIIVTDGVSTIESKTTVPEANLARLQAIRIFGIGVGLANTSELEGIAGNLENIYTIENFDDLELKMDSLYQNICPGNPDIGSISIKTLLLLFDNRYSNVLVNLYVGSRMKYTAEAKNIHMAYIVSCP